MAEVNKGPLSTILMCNTSTWRTRDRGKRQRKEGTDNDKSLSYAGLILCKSIALQNVPSSAQRL